MIRGAFFSTSRASVRRESSERATRDSRRLFSAPCAHPGDAPAWSRQRAIRGGFLQPLARIRETRQRGAGNARFAAAFFSPLRASARRASAEQATRDSRRLSSTSRARPRDAPARSGQRANRGGFFQPLARVRETRQRGAGNSRFAALFFSPSRASARRASAERATRDSRRLFSAPCAHSGDAKARSGQLAIRGGFHSAPRSRPRDAPARSGQRAIRGGFLQPLARIRETRQLTTICRQFAALQPLARIRETRKRGVGNSRFAAAFFSTSRASARRASVE